MDRTAAVALSAWMAVAQAACLCSACSGGQDKQHQQQQEAGPTADQLGDAPVNALDVDSLAGREAGPHDGADQRDGLPAGDELTGDGLPEDGLVPPADSLVTELADSAGAQELATDGAEQLGTDVSPGDLADATGPADCGQECGLGDVPSDGLSAPSPTAGCGLEFYDESLCQGCGDGQCSADENEADCPADCCDPAACSPESGSPAPDGKPPCAAAEDGTPCPDGDPGNGLETCRNGVCRHEPAACLCFPPGGTLPIPDPAADKAELEPLIEWPAWTGTVPEEPGFEEAWGLHAIDLSAAWQVTRGDPDVVLAVVDSGCEAAHPDLAGRIVAQWDVIDGDGTAQDDSGHGTMMATIAAGAEDGQGAVGVAPDVSLACIRVAGTHGFATYADLAAGIDKAVELGADVVLIGLTGYGSGAGLAQVTESVQKAAAAGLVLVAPAGSSGGSNLDAFPAALAPHVVSVAAMGQDGLPDVDGGISPATSLLAPGVRISGSVEPGAAAYHDGASVAAAMAAGTAALVRSVLPQASALHVAAILRTTGRGVPLEGWERLFSARRLDAGAAVAAAAAKAPDPALRLVEAIPESPLPGQETRVVFRVVNAGAVASGAWSVLVSADGGTVGLAGQPKGGQLLLDGQAGLEPGEWKELTVAALSDPGADPMTVTVDLAGSGGNKEDNDSAAVEIKTATWVKHHVRIRSAELLSPAEGETALVWKAVVENTGHAEEPKRILRAVLWPEANLDEIEIPSLMPGERAEVLSDLNPDGQAEADRYRLDLLLAPAKGQKGTLDTSAVFRFQFANAGTPAQTAYVQLPGDNLVADAPWRTVTGKIPVLFYFARTSWTEINWVKLLLSLPKPAASLLALESGDVRLGYVTVRNPAGPLSGKGAVLYRDEHDEPPDPVPAGATVVDEWSNPIAGQEVIWEKTPRNGEHRILWIPVGSLSAQGSSGMLDPAATGTFLEVEFRYKTSIIQLWNSERTRRMMAVEIGANLPQLSSSHHYWDAHFHSIAEWYRGNYPLGPCKALGGPLAMVAAAASSLGFVSGPDLANLTEGVITTDHNTFFDDDDAPEAGPSAKEKWGGGEQTNSPELDIYRQLLGPSAGEEVSLTGDMSTGSTLGLHLLVYRNKHVNGDWGLGQLGAKIEKLLGDLGKKVMCTPTADNVLLRIACNPGAAGPCPGQGASAVCTGANENPDAEGLGAFAFPAHPWLGGFTWSPAELTAALSLPPANTKKYQAADGEFVVKGYQIWNARSAQKVSSDILTGTLRDINPYVGANDGLLPEWKTWEADCSSDKSWRLTLQSSIEKFMAHLRDGLEYSVSDEAAPRPRFNRKIFFVGGSDAHGDFNYQFDIAATIAFQVEVIGKALGLAEVSDNAFGRPRTYTLGSGASMEDIEHGRSIVTDGPVVELELDPESRGAYNPFTGDIEWHDANKLFEDPDGRIGGDGKRDGGRTALVPYIFTDKDAQSPILHYRCANIDDFGGSKNLKIEFLVSGKAGSADPPHTVALGPPAECDGQYHDLPFALGAGGEPMDRSVALLAHLNAGGGCPGIYDAYTNPIWAGVVTVNMPVTISEYADGTGTYSLKMEFDDNNDVPISLTFPVSMKDEPIEAQIYQIKPDNTVIKIFGGVGDAGMLEPLPIGGTGFNDLPPPPASAVIKDARLTLRIPKSKPIIGNVMGKSPGDVRFVLVVRRKTTQDDPDPRLKDAFGNPLAVFMARFKAKAGCPAKSCSGDFEWCKSKCQCVLAWDCPPMSFGMPECDCCFDEDCDWWGFCYCTFCVPKEDYFYEACPGG